MFLDIHCFHIAGLTLLSVGRRTDSFPRGRRTSLAIGYSLLPRLWLQAYHDPALSRERAGAPATATAVPGTDDGRRKGKIRRGSVLGELGSGAGERRRLQVSM